MKVICDLRSVRVRVIADDALSFVCYSVHCHLNREDPSAFVYELFQSCHKSSFLRRNRTVNRNGDFKAALFQDPDQKRNIICV